MSATGREDLPAGDYVSPNLSVVRLDHAFPNMVAGNARRNGWPYLRREVPHNWYVDRRSPDCGFLSRDEAHIVYHTALQFQGKRALEIGCWLGWSAAHLALARVQLDVIDPLLGKPEFRNSVTASLGAAGVLENVQLHAGSSPGKLQELLAQENREWSLIFIDGDHEGTAPLQDAIACAPHAAADAVILFHDLASPYVAEGLNYLRTQGWQTMIYETMQIMGVAWRGNVKPLEHHPDPAIAGQLPAHLASYPISGRASPAASGPVSSAPRTRLYDRLEIPDALRSTSIRPEQAEYMERFIRERGCKRTMEVGLAFGCSAAYFMAATGAPHLAIDPYQDRYGDIGLKNIAQLGWAGRFELRRQLSRTALPQLELEGRKFDFIFVDGGHKFDEVLLDWALSDPLLDPGGFIMLNDLWMPSVKHTVAFIAANCSHYRRLQVGHPNVALFQKTAQDSRAWDHFIEFCPQAPAAKAGVPRKAAPAAAPAAPAPRAAPGPDDQRAEALFTSFYKGNLWGGKESASGTGSSLERTEPFRGELRDLFASLKIATLLDIPCGDFNWMASVDLGEISYVGGDIVADMVQRNNALYGNSQRAFRHMNLAADPLPRVDLVFCRDCLVHFSFADVFRALRNIRASGSTYLLTTSFTSRAANTDIRTGGWRPLNLERAPFALPKPLRVIDERCMEDNGVYRDKVLALWRVADIAVPSAAG